MRTFSLLAAAALIGCTGNGTDDDTPPDPPRSVTAEGGADVEVEVGVAVVLDGTGSTAGDALWDMGDGTVLEGLIANHTYDEPGNYVAVLSVTGPGGLTATDSVRVTAYLPAQTPAPASSGHLAIDPVQGEVWVPVPEADHMAVVDTTDGSVRTVDACDTPRSVAASGGRIAFTCELGGTVVLYDTAADSEIDRFDLGIGSRPFGVVGQGIVFTVVTQSLGRRITIDGLAVEREDFGTDLRAVALTSDGTPWATRWRSPGFRGELYAPAGLTELALDPGPDTDTNHRGVPNLLGSILISPDGGTMYVGGVTHNNQRGLARDGRPLTFESVARPVVRILERSGDTYVEDLDAKKVFDNQDRISAMALSPRGNWLWVAHPGTGTVQRVDAYTLDINGSILDAGIGVNGLAVSDDGDTLYVHAWLDRELRAYDVSEPGSIPTLLWAAPTVEEEPLTPTILAGKKLFHDSADMRMARHGYLNCAVCHPDGRDDGRVWDFTDRGEGLRNTISLEGHGGTDMGLLHWTGNADEVQDFEKDIRLAQEGSGLLDDADWEVPETQAPLGDPKAGLSADLDALAAYVGSLTRLPESPYISGTDGADLFSQNGCDVCHPPSTWYTDSADGTGTRHDVGTWTPDSGFRLGSPFTGFDTPTLHGLWVTAPYLHDGSANNIEDAIARHDGVVLTPQEIITIAAFLRTL